MGATAFSGSAARLCSSLRPHALQHTKLPMALVPRKRSLALIDLQASFLEASYDVSCQSFSAHAWIWAQLVCGSVQTDTGDRRVQVHLLSQAAQCQRADRMPTPCLVSALCPLWPPSCADLRVHSRLWVHDQRESQQHHDDPPGAHSAAEQVPSESGRGQPRPRCWWLAVLLGRGLVEAMAPGGRLNRSPLLS